MTELSSPVRHIFDAVNGGDTDAFLAAFVPDGSVDDWGRVFTGRAQIRSWSDNELIGKQATLDPTSVSENDGEVTVVATVGGNGFNGPSTFIFRIAGEKVAEMRITA